MVFRRCGPSRLDTDAGGILDHIAGHCWISLDRVAGAVASIGFGAVRWIARYVADEIAL